MPPSTDTSTPATTPPASPAVPLIDTRLPLPTEAPAAGDAMAEEGAIVSNVMFAWRGFVASAPVCSDAGCAPMSASRFTVACCTA